MSLINDALRKAQNDTNHGRLNPVAVGMAGSHVRPTRENSWTKILVGVLFILISAWAVTLLLSSRKGTEPSITAQVSTAPEGKVSPVETVASPDVHEEAEQLLKIQKAAPVASSNIEPVAAPTLAPIPSETVAVANQIPAQEKTLEPAPKGPTAETTSQPAGNVEVPAVAQTEAPTPAKLPVATPEPAKAEPIPTAPDLHDQIVYELKQLDVTAVMGDGNNTRIMSGGQIHRSGELINLDLKIRFQGKKDKILFFTDANGEIYKKNL
ncbi:MAG: hypothetical protein KJT03_00250 [Verrucomicrobiae bacterium]|nr:hypothetical protein [Verrucomicrobiae bacterium]